MNFEFPGKSGIKLLGGIFILAVFLNYIPGCVNLPSYKRAKLVLPDAQVSDAFVPELLETRKEVYKSYKSQQGVPPVLRTYDSSRLRGDVRVDVKGREIRVPIWVINNMRGFLLQSFNPDEQQLTSALERIRKNLRRPDPKFFYYGGAYVYSAGAFLYLASKLAAVRLSSDVGYYFKHPGEMRKIYIILKLWGVLFTSLSVFLVFYSCAALFNERAGIFAALFLALSPGVIVDAGGLKPYGFVLFWIVLAFIFLISSVRTGRRIDFFLSSAFMALAAGSLYLCIFLVPAFAVSLYAAPAARGRTAVLLESCLVFAAVFLAVNPYFLLNTDIVYKEFVHVTSCAPFKVSIRQLWAYFAGTLPSTLSAGTYIFSLAGLVKFSGSLKKETYVYWAAFIPAIFYTAFTNYSLAHYSVVFAPFLVVAAGYFADSLWNKKLGRIAVIAAILLAVLNVSYYASLWLREDTRISAGRWINKNVPSGSSIAASGSFSGPGGYPAFKMWDYKLDRYADADATVADYYIGLEGHKEVSGRNLKFEAKYRPLCRWKNNIDFFEKIFFAGHIVKNYGREIVIYKRI